MNIPQSAIVALGSNLGDSRQNILRAMERLQELSDSPLLRSSLWVTSPVDCPPNSPPFVNAIVALEPKEDATPNSLLDRLQEIEREFGRRPKQVMNEARALDLDLIAFGDRIYRTERLVLPHPRAYQRRFVLQPLNEMAPDLILPGQQKTVVQLLQTLPPDPNMRPADEPEAPRDSNMQ